MLVSLDKIRAAKDAIAKSDGRLVLMAQNPANNHHWSKSVTMMERDEWLQILALADLAARIRNLEITGSESPS